MTEHTAHAFSMITDEIKKALRRLLTNSNSIDDFLNDSWVYEAVLRKRNIKIEVVSKLKFSPIK